MDLTGRRATMNAIWALIATKIWELLWPKIEQQFNEWLPKIIKTVVVSMSQAAGQLVVDTEDKITDIIPGQLDDQILDPIIRNTVDMLKQFGINLK